MPTKNGHEFVVVAFFSHDLKRVITGFSQKHQTRNFISDGLVPSDYDVNGGEEPTLVCAYRGLEEKAGISKSDIRVIKQINMREWVAQDKVSRSAKFIEYFFVAVAKNELVLSKTVAKEGRLSDRNFTDIPFVLNSWKLPRGDKNRLNMYHAIGLTRGLLFARDKFGATKEFAPFIQMLSELQQRNGIVLDSYVTEIANCLRALKERRNRPVYVL